MFSILEPHKKIPIHVGPTKLVLRYHLGLIVPKEKEQCFITIKTPKDDHTRFWEIGEDMMFDDTFDHFVENNTDEQRVVLFLDIQKDFNNSFINALVDLFFYLLESNVTVTDIYTNVNLFYSLS
jgi:beta-hydroxylase